MQINELLTKCETSAPMLRRRSMRGSRKVLIAAMLLATAPGICLAQWFGANDAFLPSPVVTASTVPPNGDVNPYGVAFVPKNFQTGSGPLKHGDILVSNFNNSANIQGTGTTIVSISPSGVQTVFFQGTAPLGLSTALGTLQKGFVVVGNSPDLPSTQTAGEPGSLLVINNQGQLIQTITSPWIQAPWDMALVDLGDKAIAFVANALNGTISRLDFKVNSWGLSLQSATTIASGYVARPDPVTFFVAPTGLVYDASRDRLYVASTGDNAVFAINDAARRQKDAGMGSIVYADNVHLHGALGLAAAPNGHLLVTNNDGINPDPTQPSEIVEFTKQGEFVKEIPVDPAQGGSFGLAVSSTNNQAILAAVDDNTGTLIIWTLNLE
jgi:DNA-binding beta-propeller fold protein YncE